MKKVVYIQQYLKNSGYHPSQDLFPEFFTYGFGGRLGRMFKKYNPDYEVEVWRLDSSVKEYLEAKIEDIIFKVFPSRGNRVIGIYSLLFLKQLQALPEHTIINIQNFHNLLTYHILLFASKKIIITAHHHGEWSPYFRIKRFKGLKKFYSYLLLFLEYILVNRTDHIFIIDKRAYAFLKNIRDSEKKVSLTSSGIEFDSWEKIKKNDARKSLGLNTNKKYLFYLGKYYEYKAVDKLCKIYGKVKQSNPNIQLIVAGGTKGDKYYQNIQKSGAINFNLIPNNELPKYYSAADVYVCVSHLTDWFGGIGVAMLESLACGTPVISNSLNQLPDTSMIKFIGKAPKNDEEMIKDIIYVLNHPEEYKDCREIVKKYYDYELIQRKTREIYEQLINSHTKSNHKK